MASVRRGRSPAASIWLAIALLASIAGCGDTSRRPGADTSAAADTPGPAGAAESSRTDSSAMQTSPATPRGELPPPGGETHRQGSSVTPRYPVAEDPPPNLTGETRNSGGTMPRGRDRDSVTGPKMMIDSKGNVTPIRR